MLAEIDLGDLTRRASAVLSQYYSRTFFFRSHSFNACAVNDQVENEFLVGMIRHTKISLARYACSIESNQS